MYEKKISCFKVLADPETGEWLTSPEFIGEFAKSEWLGMEDDDTCHYDTYEEWVPDKYGILPSTSETRGIKVIWEEEQ